jgi:2-polyprenyl-3-methyl-5-hydroxy-6-metoxy-1,4-benzoquinol methylase
MNPETQQAQLLSNRLFSAGLAAAELLAIYIGVELGLYHTLSEAGPSSAATLAQRAGIAPRYAREWLEQQAAAGILEVDDATKPAESRLYLLPEGHRETLIETDSVFYAAPMALLPIASVLPTLPQLLQAYRTGAGVPFSAYGHAFQCAQSNLNRSVFHQALPRWLRTLLPQLHARLNRSCCVADVGCGMGWSSIALARAYVGARVDGFDISESAVTGAKANAAAAGVSDRVQFMVKDIACLDEGTRYDAMFMFDALHDLSQPVDVLRTCRRLLVEDGVMLLMEPKAGEAFRAPTDETERFLYAISLLHCLPVGLADQPSAGTGTVLRPKMVREFALAAGFTHVSICEVDHKFYRLYLLSNHAAH